MNMNEDKKYFSIKETSFGRYKGHILLNNNTGESIEVIYTHGLTIKSIKMLFNNEKLFDVIHGHASPEELELKPFAFSSTLMIPYVGRIYKGRYKFQSKEYTLPINTNEGHSIHGLLYNKSWSVKSIEDGEKASTSYIYNIHENDFNGYPFNLNVEVKIYFNINGLMILTKATNSGNTPLPIVFGWHPYLRVSNKSINDCYLLASFKKLVHTNVEKIPTGELINISNTKFDFNIAKKLNKIVLDNVFTELRYINGVASIKFYNPEENIGIELWQNETYKYNILYTPSHRKSIAIEPITGAPNAFNIPELGLKILQPNEIIEGVFGIRKLFLKTTK